MTASLHRTVLFARGRRQSAARHSSGSTERVAFALSCRRVSFAILIALVCTGRVIGQLPVIDEPATDEFVIDESLDAPDTLPEPLTFETMEATSNSVPGWLSSLEPAEEEPQVIEAPEGYEILDAGDVVDFPETSAPIHWKLFEALPTVLTKPNEPIGSLFSKIIHSEHDHPKTDLSDVPIGLQPIPERPRLLVELNEPFLSPGFLEQGIELPTGLVVRPAFWVFGEFRSAIQYVDNQRPVDPVMEWANRLDLFGQVNLTSTERFVVGMRPLDEQLFTRREFTSYDFNNGRWIDGWNGDIQTMFFEGDFGEIFPWLDPYDSRQLDYGFSVGRMAILAQQGLLINEDLIDAVTVTRNTLYGPRNLNLRITGFYSWKEITRNSPIAGPNTVDPDSRMVGVLTESDFYRSTVNVDAVYAYSNDGFGDVVASGISAIQRTHGFHNTYNTSLHVLASFPTNGATPYAQQGELLFAQTSWTPHHTEDLVYLNAFLAIDEFTSPARGPLMGGPLGQTGIVFAGAALGMAGAPVPVRTADVAGASLGYQFFFDHTRRQIIWETGGQKEYEGPVNQGAIATALRYQQAVGQHYIFILDAFVGKRESLDVGQGARAELRVKF